MKWRVSKFLFIEVPLKSAEILGLFGTFGDLETAHNLMFGLTNFQILLGALIITPLISIGVIMRWLPNEIPPPWVMRVPLAKYVFQERVRNLAQYHTEESQRLTVLAPSLRRARTLLRKHFSDGFLWSLFQIKLSPSAPLAAQINAIDAELTVLAIPAPPAEDLRAWLTFVTKLIPVAELGNLVEARALHQPQESQAQ